MSYYYIFLSRYNLKMCNLLKKCFATKKKKKDFTNRLTLSEFKKKLSPINTHLSKYSSVAKRKRKYGSFLIVEI